jgi:GTP-sensing pleiotropic transcriptional regulator CodY
MKSCCECGKLVMSGYIVCPECHSGHELTLRYYIDQLAEEIVADNPSMCSFCARGECDCQQSGFTCRRNIKTFLLRKIPDYEDNLKRELETHVEQIAFLDALHMSMETDKDDITESFMTAYPQLTEHQRIAILMLWYDTGRTRGRTL